MNKIQSNLREKCMKSSTSINKGYLFVEKEVKDISKSFNCHFPIIILN